MTLIVQKYGGSSLATPEQIAQVAARIVSARADGHDLVIVVSAMGKTTDKLLAHARLLAEGDAAGRLGERDLALLLTAGEQMSAALVALALSQAGVPAVALTGPQAGIETSDSFRDARVTRVHTQRLEEELAAGRIPVVAGFQGASRAGEVTMLGRGGSDTTAAALAAALGADACEIYTDVHGVYTADPRLVPDARRLDSISYDEMFEMASTHGGVVHPRAVYFAKLRDLPVHVRHCRERQGGTVIFRSEDAQAATIVGVALRPDIARITLTGLPDQPGALSGLLSALAAKEIAVDDITSAEAPTGGMTAALIVDECAALEALRLATSVAEQLGADCAIDRRFAKVSVVGRGWRIEPEALPRLLDTLAKSAINVHGITTSEVRVSLLVERAHGAQAVRALHAAFGLERSAAVA